MSAEVDDFNPNAHPPITRTRCNAITWFDDDPMPTICACEPDHHGDHIANIFGGNVRVVGPVVTWIQTETEENAA